MTGNRLVRAVTEPRAEIGPDGALLLLNGMEAAGRWWRQNGAAPPAGWGEMYDALAAVAIAGGSRPMPVPNIQPAETTSALSHPITATQAAFILRCSPRNVRYLCRREVLTTARRRPGGWVVEKAEVVAMAKARSETPPAT